MSGLVGLILCLVGAVALFTGVTMNTQSAMHQIYAGTWGIAGAVFFVGGAIMLVLHNHGAARRTADAALLAAIDGLAVRLGAEPLAVPQRPGLVSGLFGRRQGELPEPQPARRVATPGRAIVPEGMIRCSRCGADNSINASGCYKCGSGLRS
jgi:hypothetical protein